MHHRESTRIRWNAGLTPLLLRSLLIYSLETDRINLQFPPLMLAQSLDSSPSHNSVNLPNCT